MLLQLRIPTNRAQVLGLKEAALDRLRPVVVLAGPNGSGKSRYLRLIHDIVADALFWKCNQARLVKAIRRAGSVVSQLEDADLPVAQRIEVDINEREVEKLTRSRDAAGLTTFSGERADGTILKRRGAVRLSYEFRDDTMINVSRNFSDPLAHQLIAGIAKGSFQDAFASVDAYLAYAVRSPEEAELESFNAILARLSGVEVSAVQASGGVYPTWRGRLFNDVELSRGEKVLLTWAVMLHMRRRSMSRSIVFIDEPENHLHPDACVRAIDAVRDILGDNGQVWIATHSVPLVAYAGMDSLYSVHHGRIDYAGNQVSGVIKSLLGQSNESDRLRTFLSDAHEIAIARHAVECLQPAGVADFRSEDLQQEQFLGRVRALLQVGNPVRVLDYAPGKGRFAAALHQARLSDQSLVGIDYYAYNDPSVTSQSDAELCRAHIAALGPAETARYWEGMEELAASIVHKMDVVILCNVLHEIEPEEWLRTFQSIARVTRDDGVVLVMEDLRPSIGEMPHPRGYIVLDLFGLRCLFASQNEIAVVASGLDGRVSTMAVPQRVLSKLTSETRRLALEHVRDTSKREIERVRRRPKSAAERERIRHGHDHAHWTMQFANSMLALQRI